MTNVKQFYKELGRLLYAVAMTDGEIQQEEITALQKFVSRELALHESTSDSSGMNTAFYAQFEFDDYVKNHVSVEHALNSFIEFLANNAGVIESNLLDKTVEAMERMAASYNVINKEENALINKIREKIKAVTFYLKTNENNISSDRLLKAIN